MEPSTERDIQLLVARLFGKDYRLEQIKEAHAELILHGLLQTISEEGTKTFFLTQEGRKVIHTIVTLAEKQPDPWRRFTRKSYSQNIASA